MFILQIHGPYPFLGNELHNTASTPYSVVSPLPTALKQSEHRLNFPNRNLPSACSYRSSFFVTSASGFKSN